MANPDQSLGSFYASKCGRSVQKQICRILESYWPEIKGKRLLTIGYATPFCSYFEKQQPQIIIETDPAGKTDKTDILKISENSMPFPNQSFQHILIVNALEYAFQPVSLLKEAWRVLAHTGTLVCITPNRYSLWGVQKTMPPMQGNLFSAKEINLLLSEGLFIPKRQQSAVFLPSSAYSHDVDILDEFISYLPFSAGAFLVTEAKKQPLILAKQENSPYKSARMTKASILSSPRS